MAFLNALPHPSARFSASAGMRRQQVAQGLPVEGLETGWPWLGKTCLFSQLGKTRKTMENYVFFCGISEKKKLSFIFVGGWQWQLATSSFFNRHSRKWLLTVSNVNQPSEGINKKCNNNNYNNANCMSQKRKCVKLKWTNRHQSAITIFAGSSKVCEITVGKNSKVGSRIRQAEKVVETFSSHIKDHQGSLFLGFIVT